MIFTDLYHFTAAVVIYGLVQDFYAAAFRLAARN